ncbi:hypothetical protein Emtol_0272 (plasmid) [Emticicia oligotrophica DSM 17448]|uniref:Uncharacterized protein n=1 Tax=Emticicia oligotrophica (strain DSM 17448 / CIP 109782 / MTCC 6937 / GPTSA100-15) TaxID=929562 RepID=A0ABM5N7N9_EMTOG|nr:hypothetical protein Emtol_0272 [Emticicia oligotrophica DSM 17448]
MISPEITLRVIELLNVIGIYFVFLVMIYFIPIEFCHQSNLALCKPTKGTADIHKSHFFKEEYLILPHGRR